MAIAEKCSLAAGDLILEPDWALVFISCDSISAWSIEVSPTFSINLATSCTAQWSDGSPRGVARMQATFQGDA